MKAQYPKKKWGQNFLIDKNITNKIITALKLKKSDSILEIGPGKGALTNEISGKVNLVTAVEIDKSLCEYISKKKYINTDIINSDILKVNIEKLLCNKIIGNLPYYITTPIIFKFLESSLKWEKMFFLVQKEVAERITAQSGGKIYGRLSIMAQIFSDIKILFNVSPNCFNPIPKVESSLIQFKRANRYKIINHKYFAESIRTIFNQRRKKIKNTLPKEILINKNIDKTLLDKRPEQITIDEFVKLIN